MAKFGSKEAVLAQISDLFDTLNAGNLQADEMDLLVELTRELHERTAILRYKAYESKVFGTTSKTTDIEVDEVVEVKVENEIQVEDTPVVEEAVIETETSIEPEMSEEPSTESQSEQPIFDFNLFDEPTPEVSNEPTGFDLFDAPTVEEQAPEPELESPRWDAPVGTPTESTTDIPAVETPIKPEPQSTHEPHFTDIFSRITIANNSGSRLMMTKLDTLIGTFGLNEKLQCISELFGGSSETFTHAISELDQQTNYLDAKKVMARYAALYQWDLESELTIDFVLKVERRFM